jgi:hypothetical protein
MVSCEKFENQWSITSDFRCPMFDFDIATCKLAIRNLWPSTERGSNLWIFIHLTGNLSNKTKRGRMVTDMPCAERESLEVEVWSSMNYSRIQATADWNNNKIRVGLVPHEDRIWSSLSISMRCSQVLSRKIFILKG